MSELFISYSRLTLEPVKVLVQNFEAAGHEVWLDQELTGGHAWWEQVLEKIRECDLFVFALAPEALDSEACKREYTYAFNLRKTILPVLVAGGVNLNFLPPALAVIHYVDYQDQDVESAFNLIKALNNLPTPQPLPEPLPEPPDIPMSYLGDLAEQVGAETLSPQEQRGLVSKFRDRLRDGADTEDLRTLLQRMLKREDLLARVAEGIEELLATAPNAPPIVSLEPKGDPIPEPEPPGTIEQGVPEPTGNIKVYPNKAKYSSDVVKVIEGSLISQRLETQVIESDSGTLVQAQQPTNIFKKAMGMDQAVTISFAPVGNDLKVTVGGAKWMDKAVGAGIAAFIFAPAALTTGWAIYKQKQLATQIEAEIALYLSSRP